MKTIRKIRIYILVGALSFLIGAGGVYFYNLNWIRKVQSTTNTLILNFRDTYNIQSKLSDNYSSAFNYLANCFVVSPAKCDKVEMAKQLQTVKEERDILKVQLDQENQKTTLLLKQLP